MLARGNLQGRHHSGRYDAGLADFVGAAKLKQPITQALTVKFMLAAGAYLHERYHGRLYAKAQNLRAGLRAKYNVALAELRSHYRDLHSEAEAYYETRSEKWQESEPGAQYSAWMQQLEEAAEGIVDDLEFLEEPEDIEDLDLFDDEQWERPEDSPDQITV